MSLWTTAGGHASGRPPASRGDLRLSRHRRGHVRAAAFAGTGRTLGAAECTGPFPVSGLAGHLARAVLNVERRLVSPPPADRTPVDAVTYFLAGVGPAPDPDDAVPLRIREQEAAGGPDALAEAFDTARARLAAQLPAMPPDRPVGVFVHVLPLDQCLLTRLVELVVHLDDLAVSLEVPLRRCPPGPPPRSPTASPVSPWPVTASFRCCPPSPAGNAPPLRSRRSDARLRRTAPDATGGGRCRRWSGPRPSGRPRPGRRERLRRGGGTGPQAAGSAPPFGDRCCRDLVNTLQCGGTRGRERRRTDVKPPRHCHGRPRHTLANGLTSRPDLHRKAPACRTPHSTRTT